MILVQTDEQLVKHITQLLENEESSAKHARTAKDEARADARIWAYQEVLKIVETHQKQAKMPKVDLDERKPAFVLKP